MIEPSGWDKAHPAPRPILTVRKLSKTFPGTAAVVSLDLTILSGEIHALVGENGSGKSTLIKILSGYHRPDPGCEVLIDGQPLAVGSADAAYALGCRFVHQDLGLVATSSVLDNLYMNTGFPVRWGTIRSSVARQQARNDLAKVGLDIDPRLPVGGLTPAVMTGVAVARAFREDARTQVKLLVFDEPTATLPDSEVQQLLAIVRQVAMSGVAVLYVTHRLDEVFDLADNVTVLRDGRKVATEPTRALNRRRLITLLVGRELDEAHAASEALDSEHGKPILEVRDLSAGPLTGVSFAARPGDIAGVAGITGSGRETLLGALFGAYPRDAGVVEVDGRLLAPMRPDLAMGLGVAYLPPDRKIQGGIMEHTAQENLTLSDLRPFWRRLRLSRKGERAETRSWFGRLSVRPASAFAERFSTFSGGNQQKILFGKWLRRKPLVLLLDEPTQGVDVGAKAELHRQLLAAAGEGAALVVSSPDADELAALCHRVLVLRDGRVAAHLTGVDVTAANISRQSLGSEDEVVAG